MNKAQKVVKGASYFLQELGILLLRFINSVLTLCRNRLRIGYKSQKGRDFRMALKLETKLGDIYVTNETIANMIGKIATNCYGVVGMVYRNKTDSIASLLKSDAMTKGIKVTTYDTSTIDVSLHIMVLYGININTVCQSIVNNVRYQMKNLMGVDVGEVRVHVESIKV